MMSDLAAVRSRILWRQYKKYQLGLWIFPNITEIHYIREEGFSGTSALIKEIF